MNLRKDHYRDSASEQALYHDRARKRTCQARARARARARAVERTRKVSALRSSDLVKEGSRGDNRTRARDPVPLARSIARPPVRRRRRRRRGRHEKKGLCRPKKERHLCCRGGPRGVACVGVGSSPPSVSERGGGKTLFPTFLAPVRRGLCRSGPVPSARVKAVAEVGRRLCNTTFLAPAWRGLCRSRLVPFRPVSQRAREVRRCFPPSWHPSGAAPPVHRSSLPGESVRPKGRSLAQSPPVLGRRDR